MLNNIGQGNAVSSPLNQPTAGPEGSNNKRNRGPSRWDINSVENFGDSSPPAAKQQKVSDTATAEKEDPSMAVDIDGVPMTQQ